MAVDQFGRVIPDAMPDQRVVPAQVPQQMPAAQPNMAAGRTIPQMPVLPPQAQAVPQRPNLPGVAQGPLYTPANMARGRVMPR